MAEAANDHGNVIDLDARRPMPEPDAEIVISIWGDTFHVSSDMDDEYTAAALAEVLALYTE